MSSYLDIPDRPWSHGPPDEPECPDPPRRYKLGTSDFIFVADECGGFYVENPNGLDARVSDERGERLMRRAEAGKKCRWKLIK